MLQVRPAAEPLINQSPWAMQTAEVDNNSVWTMQAANVTNHQFWKMHAMIIRIWISFPLLPTMSC